MPYKICKDGSLEGGISSKEPVSIVESISIMSVHGPMSCIPYLSSIPKISGLDFTVNSTDCYHYDPSQGGTSYGQGS